MAEYNRDDSIAYAHQWAYNRNSKYFNFDRVGGDCTNFISQCLYAGCGVMNYTRDLGWYYRSPDNRSAAWSGVEYLYNFLTTNRHSGPFAEELPISWAQPGDIIQLCFDGFSYSHSLFVVNVYMPDNILIATHSDDSDNRPLNTYSYKSARLLHIAGARD